MVPGPITQFLGPVPAVSRDHIPCLHIPLPRTQRGLSMTLPLPGPGSLAAEGARQTTPPPSTTNPGPHSPSALGQGQPLQSYVQGESRGHPWSLSSAVQYCWVLDRTDDSCLPQASSTPRHQARPFHGPSQLTPHFLEAPIFSMLGRRSCKTLVKDAYCTVRLVFFAIFSFVFSSILHIKNQ